MAITVRKGYESQFDINKMLPGEFAVTTDSHKVYVCMAPGISKELASVEELQSVLGASDEAFQAFRELLNAMESDTVITGLLTDVNNLKTGEYTISFSEAETRENIENTNTIKVILGKIAKWLKDIKNAAFYDVANNMTTATAGTHVADAYQIKLLKNQVDEQNTNISNTKTKYITDKQTISVASGTTAVSATLCAAPENGLYMINVSVSFPSNSSGFRRAGIDTQLISYQIPAAYGYPTNIPIDQTVYLEKGTNLKIWLMQNSGSTLDVTVQAKYSYIKL